MSNENVGDGVERVARSRYEREYMITLGRRLRMVREEHGLTQQAVARAAGIATDMVSRLENGHYTSPGLRTMLRIADGMGIGISALLPDLAGQSSSSPEAAIRARLAALIQRADPEELELLADIAGVVVNRRQV